MTRSRICYRATVYAQDTFFTLTTIGQFGLAMVSLTLALVTVWSTYRWARPFQLPIRIAMALVALWAFTWLSPQLYYHYYQTQFDALPWQIVIHPPPTPSDIARLLAFQAENNLSDHTKGLLGWALLAVCVVFPKRRVD